MSWPAQQPMLVLQSQRRLAKAFALAAHWELQVQLTHVMQQAIAAQQAHATQQKLGVQQALVQQILVEQEAHASQRTFAGVRTALIEWVRVASAQAHQPAMRWAEEMQWLLAELQQG